MRLRWSRPSTLNAKMLVDIAKAMRRLRNCRVRNLPRDVHLGCDTMSTVGAGHWVAGAALKMTPGTTGAACLSPCT
jgi:hypothetical protein